MITIAINGFGRIGCNFLRVYCLSKVYQSTFNIGVINIGNNDPSFAAYLFKFDSVLGQYQGKVIYEDGYLVVDALRIPIITEEVIISNIWKKYNVAWVVDCSGVYTKREAALNHCIVGGAEKVIISAPAVGEDITVIMGINNHIYNPLKDKIISLGSCTTNAAVPIVHVLDKAYGIGRGSIKTVHSYTNSQVLLDKNVGDFRRSRAAAVNIVPTTSGVFSTIEKVLPHLKGKLTGIATRVPVSNVSFVDVLLLVNSLVSIDQLHAYLYESANEFSSIMRCESNELVSSDFMGSPYSVVIDTSLTIVNEKFINVFGWYDNEWGYSMRIGDFILYAISLEP